MPRTHILAFLVVLLPITFQSPAADVPRDYESVIGAVGEPHGLVQRRDRLGGMLSYYHREAARHASFRYLDNNGYMPPHCNPPASHHS